MIPALHFDHHREHPGPSKPMFALPTLSPRMFAAPKPGKPLPFPLGDARTEYFYLGRNAVWQAVHRLGLSGAEVLVPAYHHGVEVEALLHAGVRPRFYNVERNFRADLGDLAARLTPETRAIYVIHFAGIPQPMDDILAIARNRRLSVIEDCALSLLSSDGVRPLGARGDAAVFCLYKTLPVPHGGALWMPRETTRAKVRAPSSSVVAQQLTSAMVAHAERCAGGAAVKVRAALREAARSFRSIGRLPTDAAPVGNRRLDPAQLDVGIAPIALHIARRLDFDRIMERRRRNYYALLARLRDVSPPVVNELGAGVCPLFYPLWVEDKKRVHRTLAGWGIESIDFWNEGSPLVEQGAFPEVEEMRRHVLELPIHQDLDGNDMDTLASAVRAAI